MINIGFLVSYDYKYLITSLKLVYDFSNKIVLAIDKNYTTWSGNEFFIPDSFFYEIIEIDKRGIIEIYKDNFYIKKLSPMECETRERNMLSKKLGKGWKIQLDSDEYIYNFEILSSFLKKHSYLTSISKLIPISFKGELITLFKQTKNGFFYIENKETFPFVTNKNTYSIARKTSNTIFVNLCIKTIHQSWAREYEEIEQKIFNWGHKNDFNSKKYLLFWKSINSSNYKNTKKFHPIVPEAWVELKYMKAINLDQFIKKYSVKEKQNIVIDEKKLLKDLLLFYPLRIGRFFKLNKLYHFVKKR